jgi:hypothetical protein
MLAERSSDLESGALIMVEDTRYRIQRLPIGRGNVIEGASSFC